jgi:hypothetical protein
MSSNKYQYHTTTPLSVWSVEILSCQFNVTETQEPYDIDETLFTQPAAIFALIGALNAPTVV